MQGSDKAVELTIKKKFADSDLWHQPNQGISLGCSKCSDLKVCGGICTNEQIFNCMDLCCGNHDTCDRYVCPYQKRYSTMLNEVGGFELRPYQRPVTQMIKSTSYVPSMLDIGSLTGPLVIPTVSISLYKLLDAKTGLANYSSRQEVLDKYKLSSKTKFIIDSVGEDKYVENFWEKMQPKKTAESLRILNPVLITTPNFSMHIDTVRHDNLLSMARIARCFEDFAAERLPVAVHVNGRTPHDFRRWVEYLNKSPGIYAVSYEMGTLGRSAKRRAWHANQLATLARNVERPLTLILRGGTSHLKQLTNEFQSVIRIDTTALMKAKKRQVARISDNGKLVWEPMPTRPGESIDGIFLKNISASRVIDKQKSQAPKRYKQIFAKPNMNV